MLSSACLGCCRGLIALAEKTHPETNYLCMNKPKITLKFLFRVLDMDIIWMNEQVTELLAFKGCSHNGIRTLFMSAFCAIWQAIRFSCTIWIRFDSEIAFRKPTQTSGSIAGLMQVLRPHAISEAVIAIKIESHLTMPVTNILQWIGRWPEN